MKTISRYRLAVFILSVVVVIETLALLRPSRPAHKAAARRPVPAVKGRIAIVLDDWGYNTNNLEALERIKYPLTLAVLPNLPYSGTIAAEAARRGQEVILHLPSEPREKLRLEADTIMVAMSERTVLEIISRDLESLPNARGVSNHMGSRLTEDARMMRVILQELKRRGLYFLDSMVSPKTVGYTQARKMQLGSARRDIFLDNLEDPQYIRGQLMKLKAKARQQGRAVGIGHDRAVTLRVLEEAMPELAKEGYRFVFVSELAAS